MTSTRTHLFVWLTVAALVAAGCSSGTPETQPTEPLSQGGSVTAPLPTSSGQDGASSTTRPQSAEPSAPTGGSGSGNDAQVDDNAPPSTTPLNVTTTTLAFRFTYENCYSKSRNNKPQCDAEIAKRQSNECWNISRRNQPTLWGEKCELTADELKPVSYDCYSQRYWTADHIAEGIAALSEPSDNQYNFLRDPEWLDKQNELIYAACGSYDQDLPVLECPPKQVCAFKWENLDNADSSGGADNTGSSGDTDDIDDTETPET